MSLPGLALAARLAGFFLPWLVIALEIPADMKLLYMFLIGNCLDIVLLLQIFSFELLG